MYYINIILIKNLIILKKVKKKKILLKDIVHITGSGKVA